METFITKQSAISKIFMEVKFDFKHVARTWVVREDVHSAEKKTLKDSTPGNGDIPFFEVGITKDFINSYRLIVTTTLDLQMVDDPDAFIKKFKISYHVIEDDDIPGSFFESKIYGSKAHEIVLSPDKKVAIIDKIIDIK